MKSKLIMCLASIAGLLMICGSLPAHHGSAASYVIDLKKQLTMEGTVTEFWWANPHCFILYDVKDDKGNVVHWGAETHPPTQLTGIGWTEKTLKPGDQITISIFPSKAGTPRGLLSKVVLNGKVLLDDGATRIRTPNQ